MGFGKLIKKMENTNEHSYIVLSAFIRQELYNMRDKNVTFNMKIYSQGYLIGVLWGLYTAGFISCEDRVYLIQYLLDIPLFE